MNIPKELSIYKNYISNQNVLLFFVNTKNFLDKVKIL